MEIAFGFQRLTEECELTQEKLAERVEEKSHCCNYLRLLQLPAEVQLLMGGALPWVMRGRLSLDDNVARLLPRLWRKICRSDR